MSDDQMPSAPLGEFSILPSPSNPQQPRHHVPSINVARASHSAPIGTHTSAYVGSAPQPQATSADTHQRHQPHVNPTVECCRDFLRGVCNRPNCRYHHPSPVEMIICPEYFIGLLQRGRGMECCRDYLKGSCLDKKSPVLLSSGAVEPLSDLQNGDCVAAVGEDGTSYDAVCRISGVVNKGEKDNIVRVVLADGREVICTDEHRWLVVNNRETPKMDNPKTPIWVSASDLTPGSRVLSCGPGLCFNLSKDEQASSVALPSLSTFGLESEFHLGNVRQRRIIAQAARIAGCFASSNVSSDFRAVSFASRADAEALCSDLFHVFGERVTLVELEKDALWAIWVSQKVATGLRGLLQSIQGIIETDSQKTQKLIRREYLGALLPAYVTGEVLRRAELSFNLDKSIRQEVCGLLEDLDIPYITTETGVFVTDVIVFARMVGFRYCMRLVQVLAAMSSYSAQKMSVPFMEFCESEAFIPSEATVPLKEECGGASDAFIESDMPLNLPDISPRGLPGSFSHNSIFGETSNFAITTTVPVVSITSHKPTVVFDITVPAAKTFTASGTVVHNCAHDTRCKYFHPRSLTELAIIQRYGHRIGLTTPTDILPPLSNIRVYLDNFPVPRTTLIDLQAAAWDGMSSYESATMSGTASTQSSARGEQSSSGLPTAGGGGILGGFEDDAPRRDLW